MTHASATIALAAANQLVDSNGMVPVRHKCGMCVGWIDKGNGSKQLDPASITHDFLIPLKDFSIRKGINAGGDIQHAVFPNPTGTFTIVRLEQNGLVIGDRHLPNWMY